MIIVTGAAGFIGSNIVAAFNEAGVTDIVIVDTLGAKDKWRNLRSLSFADIVMPQRVGSFLKKCGRVEAVIHMGAKSSTTFTDGDEIWRWNFQASRRWWEWCTKTRTPLIYASSAATYGDGNNGFTDSDDLTALNQFRPLNLYGWSKHIFDKWAVHQATIGEAPPQWCGLKFFNVYGPNEVHKDNMCSLVCKNAVKVHNGDKVNLFKSYKTGIHDGEQLRDFVYVKDCTAIIQWLLANHGVSGIFNVGTGAERTFVDLINAIGLAIGTTAKIEFIDMPNEIRENYQYFTRANMSKLRAAGYQKSFYTLESGVADYVRRYLLRTHGYL